MQLEPIASFALLLAVILIVPIGFERIKLPGLLGLLIAGVILGPSALQVLSNESETMHLLSDIGLVYLLFVAGLEIDLEQFRATKHRSAGFGFLTFLFPLLTGIAVGRFFGMGWNASVLIGSLLASHTLLAYPILSRLGVVNNEAVTVTIGATIFTDIGSLLVLAICLGVNQGEFSILSLVGLLLSLLIYSAVVLFGFNWLGKEFFRRSGDAEGNQFLFVLLAVFVAAIGAELIGVEKIVGAFLAGLAVNSVVGEGPVKEKIVFVGNVLFIPIFFVNTGLVINIPGFIRSLSNVELTLAIVLGLIGSKFLAALASKLLFRYGWREMMTMWSLSLPQVAATLAAAFVGFRENIISEEVLNTVIVLFVVTATLGPIITARAASGLMPDSSDLPEVSAIDSLDEDLDTHHGLTIAVPVYNPETQRNLLEMAALFARHESAKVVPLSIAPGQSHLDSPDVETALQSSETVLQQAAQICQNLGAKAIPVLRIDDDVAQGISRASREQNADIIMMGWGESQSIRARLFGSVIDRVLWASHCPVAIMRLLESPTTTRRILVPIDNLTREAVQLLLFADVLEDANNAQITLLHVCDRNSPPDREAWIQSQLQRIVARYTPFVYPDIQIVRSNDVARAIVEASRSHDLVVMRNARRRNRVSGELILSDITNRALRQITCSVVMLGEPHSHRGLMMMRRARSIQEVG